MTYPEATPRTYQDLADVTPPDQQGKETNLVRILENTFRRHGFTDQEIEIAKAQVQLESNWDTRAASGTGPRGLGQITIGTGKSYGLYTEADFFDPYKNLDAMARLLRDLHKMYNGDWRKILKAYHVGPGKVDDPAARDKNINSDVFVEKILKLAGQNYDYKPQPYNQASGSWSAPAAIEPEPTYSEVLGAAFDTSNMIGSMMNKSDYDVLSLSGPKEPDFDVNQADWTGADHLIEDYYGRVRSQKDIDNLRSWSNEYEKKREKVESSGGQGVLLDMVLSVVDPTLLIPGGVVGTVGKVGYAAKNLTTAALAAAAATAMYEGVMFETDPNHRLEDSIVNASIAALTGGALGYGSAKLIERSLGTWGQANKIYDPKSDAQAARISLGIERPSLEELGSTVGAKASQLEMERYTIASNSVIRWLMRIGSPANKVLQSPSLVARKAQLSFTDNNAVLNLHKEGEALPSSVVTDLRTGMGSSAVYQHMINNNWADYSKRMPTGPNVIKSFSEFDSLVGEGVLLGGKIKSRNILPGEIVELDKSISEAQRMFRDFKVNAEATIEHIRSSKGINERVELDVTPEMMARVFNQQKIANSEHRFTQHLGLALKERVLGETTDILSRLKLMLNHAKEMDPENFEELMKALKDKTPFELREILRKGDDPGLNNLFDLQSKQMLEGIISRAHRGTELFGPEWDFDNTHILEWLDTSSTRIVALANYKIYRDFNFTATFGDLNMTSTFKGIREDYNILKTQLENSYKNENGVVPENKLRILDKELLKLTDAQKRDEDIFTIQRDKFLGENIAGGFYSTELLRAVRDLNVTSKLGGVAITSIPDLFKPIMYNGFKPWFKGLFHPLVRVLNSEIKSTSKEMLRKSGVITEQAINARLLEFTGEQYAEPRAYASSSIKRKVLAVSKGTEKLTEKFSKISGLYYWDRFLRSTATIEAMDGVLQDAHTLASGGKLGVKRTQLLARMGLGTSELLEIARDVKVVDDHGVWKPQDLDDLPIFLERSLNKMSQEMLTTPQLGQVPLMLSKNPIFRSLTQFQSFAFASYQQLLMVGLQQNDINTYMMMTMTLMAGIGVHALKEGRIGQELPDMSDPKGFANVIFEGLDKSGILSLPFLIHNLLESSTGIGVRPLVFGDKVKVMGGAKTLLGPTIGGFLPDLVKSVEMAGTAVRGEGINAEQLAALRRLIPLQNVFWLENVFNMVHEATANAAGLPHKEYPAYSRVFTD